jgi:alkanesulfonate monooxygenase SsuD/methylene tetrahydromethanopterin reductase-like flavin-dependent oxidoreductase (luciferase family)
MSNDSRKIRFGLWYDFRNPAQWRQPADRLYREILDQIGWGENNGFDDVWLSEHHFIEDGYLPSIPASRRGDCRPHQPHPHRIRRAADAFPQSDTPCRGYRDR